MPRIVAELLDEAYQNSAQSGWGFGASYAFVLQPSAAGAARFKSVIDILDTATDYVMDMLGELEQARECLGTDEGEDESDADGDR